MREKEREYAHKWRKENIERARELSNQYYARNAKKINASQSAYQKRRRIKVLSHYSNGDIKCVCCGERAYEFMALDHINGNGSQHRRELGLKTGRDTYTWCIKNNFPKGFQVLCHNCNFALGHYSKCPHQK